MIRTFIVSTLLSLFLAANAHSQISAALDSEGFIVISGDNVELLGLDFTSASGWLVPVEDNDATPFGFLLENSSTQITYGSLNDTVTIDGDVTLGASYALPEGRDADLVASWGGVEDGPPIDLPVDLNAAFPTGPTPPTDGGGAGGTPVIPEPASGLMAGLGVLFAGILRRSRRANS